MLEAHDIWIWLNIGDAFEIKWYETFIAIIRNFQWPNKTRPKTM